MAKMPQTVNNSQENRQFFLHLYVTR